MRAAVLLVLALAGDAAARAGCSPTSSRGDEAVGSFGTLIRCEDEREESPRRCLWTDRAGRAVPADELARQLMEAEAATGDEEARRRLETHMQYVEEVHTLATRAGLAFPYRSGVSARHLHADTARAQSAHAFVRQEQRAEARRRARRRLAAAAPRRRRAAESARASLDWCSSDNPRGESVCSAVKSQQECGSCWAFAAADAIEAAAALNSRTEPQALSPQQFLACSTSAMATTFEYCWLDTAGATSAPWLERKMTWGSDNNGCAGGMTHAAFEDAAAGNWSLLAQLDLPYDEAAEGSQTYARECESAQAAHAAAASITGWEQVVGKDCTAGSDVGELLRAALLQQPVSVAINSGGAFKDYKGGLYACPDDGDVASSAEIDHALVLVGYGSAANASTGEQERYWLLKNSYGASWGERGFMRLVADDKLNCGLSVFPVVPTGAAAASYRAVVDGGGAVIFCGLEPAVWLALGGALAAATTALTALGVLCARRRRRAMQLVGE